MTRRHYTNTATEATLTAGIGVSDTTFGLTSFAGFPAPPFAATLDRGQASEEVVLVTGIGGGTATVTRGFDGTTAKTHSAGAAFLHTAIAKDFDEANAHHEATSGVHGVAGTLVGTSDAQVLTNKTLAAPVLQSPSITGSLTLSSLALSGSGSVGGPLTVSGLLSANGGAGVTGTLSVTGSSTLAALTATTGTFASLASTGSLTVGGTATMAAVNGTNIKATGTLIAQGATTLAGLTAGATSLGALTGTTATFSGTVTVPTATASGHAVNKAQLDASTVNGAWQPLTIGAGYTRDTGVNQCQARLMADGSTVQLRGGVVPTDGAVNGGDLLVTIPVGLRPAAGYRAIVQGGGDSLVNLNINNTGTVTVRFWQGSNMAVAPNVVSLDGIWFAL
jgi:hypothetical protein